MRLPGRTPHLAALAVAVLAFAALAVGCSRTAPPPGGLPHAAVTSFARVPSLDTTGNAGGVQLPNRVLARYGGSTEGGPSTLTWKTPTGRTTVAPSRWVAYRSPEGEVFWLAGTDGKVALVRSREGTSALLVDASAADRILARYDLR